MMYESDDAVEQHPVSSSISSLANSYDMVSDDDVNGDYDFSSLSSSSISEMSGGILSSRASSRGSSGDGAHSDSDEVTNGISNVALAATSGLSHVTRRRRRVRDAVVVVDDTSQLTTPTREISAVFPDDDSSTNGDEEFVDDDDYDKFSNSHISEEDDDDYEDIDYMANNHRRPTVTELSQLPINDSTFRPRVLGSGSGLMDSSEQERYQAILNSPSLSTMSLGNSNSTLRMPMPPVLEESESDGADVLSRLSNAQSLTVESLSKDLLADANIKLILPNESVDCIGTLCSYFKRTTSSRSTTSSVSPSSSLSDHLNIIGFGANEETVKTKIRQIGSRLNYNVSGKSINYYYCQPINTGEIWKNYIIDPRRIYGLVQNLADTSPPNFSYNTIAVVFYSSTESYLTFNPAKIYSILERENIPSIALSDEIIAPSIIKPSNWHILASECAPRYGINVNNEVYSIPIPTDGILSLRAADIEGMIKKPGQKSPILLESISNRRKPVLNATLNSLLLQVYNYWFYFTWLLVLLTFSGNRIMTAYSSSSSSSSSLISTLSDDNQLATQSTSTHFNFMGPTDIISPVIPTSVLAETTDPVSSVIIPAVANCHCRDVISRNPHMDLSCHGSYKQQQYKKVYQESPKISEVVIRNLCSAEVMVWNAVSNLGSFLISQFRRLDNIVSATLDEAINEYHKLILLARDTDYKSIVSTESANPSKIGSEISSYVEDIASKSYDYSAELVSEGSKIAKEAYTQTTSQVAYYQDILKSELMQLPNRFTDFSSRYKRGYKKLSTKARSVTDSISSRIESTLKDVPNQLDHLSSKYKLTHRELSSNAKCVADSFLQNTRDKLSKVDTEHYVNNAKSMRNRIITHGQTLSSKLSSKGQEILSDNISKLSKNTQELRDKMKNRLSPEKKKVLADKITVAKKQSRRFFTYLHKRFPEKTETIKSSWWKIINNEKETKKKWW